MGRRGRFLSLALAVCLAATSLAPATSVASVAAYRSINVWPAPTWHLDKPTGVAFDSAGNAYVVCRDSSQIKKFSPSGVLLATFGSEGTAAGQFKNPTGVAVDRASNWLYVADTGNHRMQKLTLAGASLKVWGKSGGPDMWGSGNGEFFNPTGVAVGDGGYVYVADRDNNRIQKFDSEGVFKLKWGNPGQADGQFYSPHGIATDASGRVYVVEGDKSMALSRIQVFDPNGVFIAKQGRYCYVMDYPQGEGKYVVPKAIAVDNSGHVYVADTLGHVMQRLTITESPTFGLTYEQQWAGYYRVERKYKVSDLWGPERPLGEFWAPEGCAIDPSGNLWVCDTQNDRIVKYTSGLELIAVNGSWGKDFGYFNTQSPDTGAMDVAVSPDGWVYASDRDNYRVQKFDSDGNVQVRYRPAPWNTPIPWLGQWDFLTSAEHDKFDKPAGIVCDSLGNVYVADSGNNAIKKFAPDGTYINVWGESGGGIAWLNNPQDVAVDAADNVYVADTGNNRIQKFDKDNLPLKSWPAPDATADLQLNKPAGIAVDQTRSSVFVSDTLKHRIVRYDLEGNRTGVWGSFGSAAGQFSSPMGLAVDASGNVFVADRGNNRIQKFTASGAFLAQFGTYGPERDQLMAPTGVAVDDAGIVYVADRDNCRVQKFAPPVVAVILGVEDGGAYKEAVNVSIVFERATDTEVRLNGVVVPWTDQLISEEGEYAVYAWATNGEQEAEDYASFCIDLTPPETTAQVDASYVNGATIELEATDNLSGVSRTLYRLDDGDPQLGATVQCGAAGHHTLEYWSEDEAGNTEVSTTREFDVIDDLPPVTSIANPKSVYTGKATITLVPSDPSGVAHTWWRLDGGTAKEGTSITVSTPGAYVLEYWSQDTQGNTEEPRVHPFTVIPATLSVVRMEGANRYVTAVAASKRAFTTAETVVLATGENWPDALGGAALAGVKDGPILLTKPDELPECVKTEMTRLKTKNVIVLGGDSAVGVRVITALYRAGLRVTRIPGTDRYDTARKVAAEVVKDPDFSGTAFVATGESFPDALAASPLAFKNGWPVFLVRRDGIDRATLNGMHASEVDRAVVLGSEGAVGGKVYDALAGFTRLRLSGANRYSTAVAVAAWGVGNGNLGWNKLAIARGDDFPDALGGGAVQGKTGSVMLLTPRGRLDASTEACLKTHKGDVTEVRFLGGDGAIPTSVRSAVASALKR